MQHSRTCDGVVHHPRSGAAKAEYYYHMHVGYVQGLRRHAELRRQQQARLQGVWRRGGTECRRSQKGGAQGDRARASWPMSAGQDAVDLPVHLMHPGLLIS